MEICFSKLSTFYDSDKTALRLGRYDREHLVNFINNVDNYIIDKCPYVYKCKNKY